MSHSLTGQCAGMGAVENTVLESSLRDDAAELCSRSYAELGKDAVQMGTDRAMGQKQTLADLLVRQPPGRELSNVQLVGRELVTGVGASIRARLSGRAQLLAGSIAPRNKS